MMNDEEKSKLETVNALVNLAKSRIEGIRLRLGIAEQCKAEKELIEAKDILFDLTQEK